MEGLPFQQAAIAAVEVIAEKRMAEMREVYADLMRAARVQDEAQQGKMSI